MRGGAKDRCRATELAPVPGSDRRLWPYANLRRLFERLSYAKIIADYESLLPLAAFTLS
jgi:hypothetical protein